MTDEQLARALAVCADNQAKGKRMPLWHNVTHDIQKPEGEPVFVISEADPWGPEGRPKEELDTVVTISEGKDRP